MTTAATTEPTATPAVGDQQQQQVNSAPLKGAEAFTAFRDYEDPTYNEEEDEDYNGEEEEGSEDDEEGSESSAEEEEEVTQEEAQDLLKDNPQPDVRKVLRGGKVIPDAGNVREITTKIQEMFDNSMTSTTVEPR